MEKPVTTLTGPELVPETVTSLVIFSHGYGSNGQDMLGLARQFTRFMPQTAFLCPNAPEPCPGAPNGYQWFGVSSLNKEERDTGPYRVAHHLDRFIDDALARFDLEASRLALSGFSQGTMMSLHVGLRREAQPAGILGYSGCLSAPARLKHEIRNHAPVFLIHGANDQVLPPILMFEAIGALEANDVPVDRHLSPDTPHSIDPGGLQNGIGFLKHVLK